MKKIKRGRDVFSKYKFLLSLISKLYSIFPLTLRKKIFEKKRYSKGIYGIAIRYALIKSIAFKCGDNVLINQGCFILNPDKLSIGNNVSIQPMSYIDAAGEIVIGDDVSIAHGVTILSSTHNYFDIELPIKEQGMSYGATEIKSNVWVGAKATILCGVVVETGSIIGTGAVVTRRVKKNTIVAGVPAKIIKER